MPITIPPATNFAEGQRKLALLLAAGGGVFCGLAIGAIIGVFWQGAWEASTQGQRITGLTIIAGGLLAGLLAVIVGLLIGGPVGRLKASVGRDGGSLEAEGDEVVK